ncbi:glycosyltransferase family 4 protein [Candidatus Uhrbacteria bacterium]|nr:glycosyltransferase family 4 protein [Candidatus Uhrbacteria bacterium]
MRILMVIGQYRPVIGGAQRQCELLARTLVARGYVVRVLTMRSQRGDAAEEIVDGVVVERIKYPILTVAGRRMSCGFLAPLLFWWRVIRRVRQCDAVIGHQALWPAFVACVAARWHGVPMIVKLGNSGERFDLDVLQRLHWYGAFARRYIRRHVTRFIATSQAVHDDLSRSGLSGVQIADIPNGVALPTIVARTIPSDVVRFIAVGNLTSKKNFRSLVAAFAMLPEPVASRCRLTIVGDGPERDILERAVHDRHLEERVILAGCRDDPASEYVTHDVFVLPSRTEGLSNAALEAMAHGLPVVLSDAGGNPELVPNPVVRGGIAVGATGVLVPPNQLDALSAAMEDLVRRGNDRRAMGVRARALVEERFSIARVCDAYEALLGTVTAPRIVHLLTFLDSQTGGMERQALQLAAEFRTRGRDVTGITCVHRSAMRRMGVRRTGILRDVPIHRIPLRAGWERWNAVRFACGAFLYLLTFRRRPVIIHAHQLWTSGLIASAARRLLPRARVLVKNCSGGVIGDIRQLRKFPCADRVLQFLRRGCDAFIAVSEETDYEMRAAGLGPIVAIPNAVDTMYFAPAAPDARAAFRHEVFGSDIGGPMILFVGRLVPKKRVAVILDAVARLGGDAVLCIIGDGPLRASLEARAQELGVVERVWFLGHQADVRPAYHAADVLVLPSENEGMPNVLVEAMSCGVPVIGTAIPSIRALVDDGVSGLLVPLDDEVALADALRRILSNQIFAQTLATAGRERVRARYTLPAIAEAYARVYHALATGDSLTV